MDKLTPGIRKAIELRELGELSIEEAARVMGLSVAAVKGRLFHWREIAPGIEARVRLGVRKTDLAGEP